MPIKCVVILQARMNSTRLPGKVLMDLAGQPMLAQQLRRLKQCKQVDEIVVATTLNGSDDVIEQMARQAGVRCFRGSETDVLSRFVGAAHEANADLIVRLTADCPLIDPEITDKVIHELIVHANEFDYASNTIRRTFPRGMDIEVFFIDTLFRLDRLAQSPTSREHVTTFLRSDHPELFLILSIEDQHNNSDLRWTVDTMADLEFVRLIYEKMNLNNNLAPFNEILDYVRNHPELVSKDGVETWDPLR